VQHGGWSSVGRVRNLHSNASGGADTGLTHVDDSGKASMVDVGDKPTTTRTAVASGLVLLGETAFGLVQKNGLKKGDVLTVAEIAGIMGAKQCSTLIPLCHPVALTKVDVSLVLLESENAIRIGALSPA
jgi:cyclic pyranopterin phosphate synthase